MSTVYNVADQYDASDVKGKTTTEVNVYRQAGHGVILSK